MKQLGELGLARELLEAVNGILRRISTQEITGGEFSEVLKKHENAVLQFMEISKKELQKKDYLQTKALFQKIY